jgi:hypothetical protein
LAQAGMLRNSSRKWLYFERSEIRENGLFSKKHYTIFAAMEVLWCDFERSLVLPKILVSFIVG